MLELSQPTCAMSAILQLYERSPYYFGTKLWSELSKEIQTAPNVYAFKNEIDRMNRVYVKL